MNSRIIREDQLKRFESELEQAERSPATIEKYLRDVGAFAAWLAGAPVTKEGTAAWKAALLARGLAPATVNSMLAAVNHFLTSAGLAECRVRPLRLQRQLFREAAGS